MGASPPCPGNLGATAFSFSASAAAEHLDHFLSVPSDNVSPALPLSSWSASMGKRIFDIACVLCALPLALPIFLAGWFAVRLTSRGPALFRQERMGRDGRCFTILKFRTMPVCTGSDSRPTLTSSNNQRFTLIGPFLRRWKLDELPQLINILRGEMSLVGPRPKLACYESVRLVCRPGLTGFATIVFAREEMALSKVPPAQVNAYYQAVVKPFKCRLDTVYMARATFLSDLKIIFKSILRDWDDVALSELPQWDAEKVVLGQETGPTVGVIASALAISQ
jgi:lipopolysaccharide/colanic/teichoic acid biosynthesis glycosyltransferase